MKYLTGWRLITSWLMIGLFVFSGCGSDIKEKPATEKQTPKEVSQIDKTGGTEKSPQPGNTQTKTATPKTGGEIIIGVYQEISTMNPQIDTKSTNQSVRTLMYESLLATNEKLEDIPQLAERWEISADGKEYTFFLRQGVKFHDGKAMTAKDVKWSAEYAMEPKNAAYGRPYFEKVKAIEIIDNYTIKFVLKEREAAFLSYFNSLQSFPVTPEGSLVTGVDKPATFPPGTGPFKFGEYKAGQHLTVTRFDGHWGEGPFLDRIVIKMPVPDESVRFAALRAGDLALIQRAPFQWVQKLVSGEIKGINYSESAAGQFRRIVFNLKSPPFDNVKMRQAVLYALDKQELIEAGYWGFGYPTNEKMIKGSPWRVDAPDVKRDLKKVQQLLQEAGYSGEEVVLLGFQGDEERLQVVNKQLNEAGIKTKIEISEFGAYFVRLRDGVYQFTLYGGSTASDPSVTYTPDLLTEPAGKRGANISAYSNPEMDRMLQALGSETNFDTRKEIYRKLLTVLWEDSPEIYLALVPGIWAFTDNLKGFIAHPQDFLNFPGGGLSTAWLEK